MLCDVSGSMASVKMTAFWDMAPFSLVEVDWRAGGVYGLRH
jgi:hypothetical protein